MIVMGKSKPFKIDLMILVELSHGAFWLGIS